LIYFYKRIKMGSSEKFCLRWNDFETNISVAFRELREDKDFFDVTLACDDDQIQAHKVILSACSPFFRTILKRNRHEHPLLYLKGVKYIDLMAVLNFMYHGEVNVAQEDLNVFLAIAEDLKVKGLTQTKSEEIPKQQKILQNQKVHSRDTQERSESIPQLKRSRPVPATESVNINRVNAVLPPYEGDDDVQEVIPIKTEPTNHLPEPQHLQLGDPDEHSQVVDPNMDNSMGIYEENYAEYETYDNAEGYDDTMATGNNVDGNKELDLLINNSMAKDAGESGVWRCLRCNVANRHKARVRIHVETHFECQQICSICNQVCKTRDSLRKHLAKMHRNNYCS